MIGKHEAFNPIIHKNIVDVYLDFFFFFFADLDAISRKIKNELYSNDKDIESNVLSAMTEIRKAKLTKEEFFGVYKQLAQEAFVYGAESGSEKTGLWMVTFLYQMNYRIRDMNKAFIILIDCGFTLYNLVLDVNGRYGRGHTTKGVRENNINNYKKTVVIFQNYFKKPVDAKHYYLNALTALINLIDLANFTSTHKMDDAKDKMEKLHDDLENFPNFLSALFKYHIALVYFSSLDRDKAISYLYSAYESLKVYITQYTSPSAYCFNVIHGKYLEIEKILFEQFSDINRIYCKAVCRPTGNCEGLEVEQPPSLT